MMRKTQRVMQDQWASQHARIVHERQQAEEAERRTGKAVHDMKAPSGSDSDRESYWLHNTERADRLMSGSASARASGPRPQDDDRPYRDLINKHLPATKAHKAALAALRTAHDRERQMHTHMVGPGKTLSHLLRVGPPRPREAPPRRVPRFPPSIQRSMSAPTKASTRLDAAAEERSTELSHEEWRRAQIRTNHAWTTTIQRYEAGPPPGWRHPTEGSDSSRRAPVSAAALRASARVPLIRAIPATDPGHPDRVHERVYAEHIALREKYNRPGSNPKFRQLLRMVEGHPPDEQPRPPPPLRRTGSGGAGRGALRAPFTRPGPHVRSYLTRNIESGRQTRAAIFGRRRERARARIRSHPVRDAELRDVKAHPIREEDLKDEAPHPVGGERSRPVSSHPIREADLGHAALPPIREEEPKDVKSHPASKAERKRDDGKGK